MKIKLQQTKSEILKMNQGRRRGFLLESLVHQIGGELATLPGTKKKYIDHPIMGKLHVSFHNSDDDTKVWMKNDGEAEWVRDHDMTIMLVPGTYQNQVEGRLIKLDSRFEEIATLPTTKPRDFDELVISTFKVDTLKEIKP